MLNIRRRGFLKWLAAGLLILIMAGLAGGAVLGMVATGPVQSGVTVYSNDKAAIDASNLAEGYLMIKYTGGRDVKIKVQIAKQGGATYSYDLNSKGNPEIYPLTEGEGKYTVGVFEHLAANKYSPIYNTSFDAKFRDALLPFLYPNQYVNYTVGSAVDIKAQELAKDVPAKLDVLKNIYYYVTQNVTYDTALAASVQPGYLPDVDAVLEKKTGICFDYAALMSAMLRLQGIPSKLVIGYAGTIYHAWINVYIEEVGWIDQAIYFDGKQWSLMDPTFVSTANSANAVQQFIGEGNSYSQKFAY